MKKPPDREAVLRSLRDHEREFRARGLAHLFLHGSVAKGSATADSDVDLFFDIEPRAQFSLFDLVGVKHPAEHILGCEADVGTRTGLHPKLRQEIERSAIQVF